MAQSTRAGTIPGKAAPRWPRLLLLIAAAIELLGGLRDLPVLFGDLSEVPGPGLGGAVIIAKIVLQPVLALLALAFTVRGRMMDALLAMALIIAMTWLNLLPSVAIDGFDFNSGSGFIAAHLVFQIFLAPIAALAVAILALTRQWTPACLLAVLPTFLGVLGVILFAISIAIYGF
jgi:hypothetical protein